MWRLTVRGEEVCWQSSEEGQRNCKLKAGDGMEPSPLCVPFYLTVETVDYFA